MKEQLRKIISVSIVCLLLLFTFSVSSFAFTNILNPDMSDSESWEWQRPADFIPTVSYDSSTDTNTFVLGTNLSGLSAIRFTVIPDDLTFTTHEYKLSFKYKGYFGTCPLQVWALIKTNDNTLSYELLAEVNQSNHTSDFGDYSIEFNMRDGGYNNVIKFQIEFRFAPSNNSAHNIYLKNVSFIDTDYDDDAGFWSSLWDWLQDIITKLNQLSLNIGTYIGGLWQNLSTAFSNLTSSIGQFFVDIGEDIAELFDTITDYILYFQHPVDLDEDGIPVDEYGNPVYENPFESPDFFDTIDDWIESIEDSKSSIEAGAEDGIDSIQSVIGPFTIVLNRVPVLLIFITFGLAIIVIKKVIS